MRGPLPPIQHRARRVVAAWTLIGAALTGCSEELPTATEGALLPVEPRTVELRLSADEFSTDVQVFGGFARPVEAGHGVVARDFAGSLDARTLTRFAAFPASVNVRDTTGATVTDTDLSVVGARIVARLDTLDSRAQGPTTVSFGFQDHEWEPRSVTWTEAVDTVGETIPWSEPGAGPVVPLGENTWDPGTGVDTLTVEVDSATVNLWNDTTAAAPSLRLASETAGSRLSVTTVSLRVEVRPSVNPDTTVIVSVSSRDLTFVFDPPPPDPEGDLRVGGAPAWRTTITLSLPAEIPGARATPPVAAVLSLEPERISYAAVVLRTRATPTAYQPVDSLRLEVHPVFSPDRLPKAPLGALQDSRPPPIPAEGFGAATDREVEVPVTRFVTDLLRGETEDGDPAPTTLALVDRFEPRELGFGTFAGRGSEGAPRLRIILNEAGEVGLP